MNNASHRTKNVSLHLACVSTLPCKIRKQRLFHVSTETFTLKH